MTGSLPPAKGAASSASAAGAETKPLPARPGGAGSAGAGASVIGKTATSNPATAVANPPRPGGAAWPESWGSDDAAAAPRTDAPRGAGNADDGRRRGGGRAALTSSSPDKEARPSTPSTGGATVAQPRSDAAEYAGMSPSLMPAPPGPSAPALTTDSSDLPPVSRPASQQKSTPQPTLFASRAPVPASAPPGPSPVSSLARSSDEPFAAGPRPYPQNLVPSIAHGLVSSAPSVASDASPVHSPSPSPSVPKSKPAPSLSKGVKRKHPPRSQTTTPTPPQSGVPVRAGTVAETMGLTAIRSARDQKLADRAALDRQVAGRDDGPSHASPSGASLATGANSAAISQGITPLHGMNNRQSSLGHHSPNYDWAMQTQASVETGPALPLPLTSVSHPPRLPKSAATPSSSGVLHRQQAQPQLSEVHLSAQSQSGQPSFQSHQHATSMQHQKQPRALPRSPQKSLQRNPQKDTSDPHRASSSVEPQDGDPTASTREPWWQHARSQARLNPVATGPNSLQKPISRQERREPFGAIPTLASVRQNSSWNRLDYTGTDSSPRPNMPCVPLGKNQKDPEESESPSRSGNITPAAVHHLGSLQGHAGLRKSVPNPSVQPSPLAADKPASPHAHVSVMPQQQGENSSQRTGVVPQQQPQNRELLQQRQQPSHTLKKQQLLHHQSQKRQELSHTPQQSSQRSKQPRPLTALPSSTSAAGANSGPRAAINSQQSHPQHRPTSSSPAIAQNQPQQGNSSASAAVVGASQRRQLKVEDALAYLEQVKQQFDGHPLVYNQFLDIMKEFKVQSIDTIEVINRVSQLFRGHKDLILGFNTFLPPGYKIEVREDRETGMLSTGFSGPAGFSELPQQRKVTDSKLATPSPAKVTVDHTSSAQVAVPVPRATNTNVAGPSATSRPSTNTAAKKRISSSPRRKDVKSKVAQPAGPTGPPPSEQTSVEFKVLSPARASHRSSAPATAHGGTAPRIGSTPDSRTGKTVVVPSNSLSDASEGSTQILPRDESDFEKALAFMDRLKQRLPTLDYELVLESLDRFRTTPVGYSVIANTLADLIGPRNKDVLYDFLDQLPFLAQHRAGACGTVARPPGRVILSSRRAVQGAKVNTASDSMKIRRLPGGAGAHRERLPGRQDVTSFFDEARVQLSGTSARLYTEFIKCLSLFSREIISREELVSMAGDLFRDHPILHTSFLQHLEAMTLGLEDIPEPQDSSASSAVPGAGQGTDPNGSGELNRTQLYLSKPISELAADSDVACTASYRKLPPDYPTLTCTGRSALEKRTLNDVWVSVTSGSEDYSFKFMRKNQFEDNLFRCEDDRYELDLVIETNSATILKLEQIATTIAMLPPSVKQRHFLADGALSPVHFNAIQRIYGESGPDIVQQIKLNPAVAVPVVMQRLRDKDDCWRRARSEMNLIWRDVGERNYHRSLDHRSGYFKQVDKKELSSKSLLCDILNPEASHAARQAEMTRARGYTIPGGGGRPNDRSPAADAVALLASLGTTASVPSLELPYQDTGIHEVIFDLISMSLRNAAHAREDHHHFATVVTKNYKQFVEVFFGVILDKESSNTQHLETERTPVVFYGDESIYLLFRLHHLMYERLAAAKQLAKEIANDQNFRKERNSLGRLRVENHSSRPGVSLALWPSSQKLVKRQIGMPRLSTAPSDLTRDILTMGTESSRFVVNSGNVDAELVFGEYLSLLRGLLEGSVDLGRYEDKCRVLLGAHSYCLCTMDKTFAKLIKQVHLVFIEENPSSEYLDLFYVSRKNIEGTINLGSARGVEDIYSIAASAALRRQRGSGANLFRIQYMRRRSFPDQLLIHVVGETCGDKDDAKRDEELSAIDKFLGFNAGLGNILPTIEEEDDTSRNGDGDSETRDEGAEGELDENGEFSGGDSPMAERVTETSAEEPNDQSNAISEKTDLKTVSGTSDGEHFNGVTRMDACGHSVKRRKIGCSSNGARKEESRMYGDGSRSNARYPFLRFSGPESRIWHGKMVICNEIEFRLGSEGQMCFVDGKSDILVNLGRKRRWRSGSASL